MTSGVTPGPITVARYLVLVPVPAGLWLPFWCGKNP
jgi:hypothetical protein